jgi:hypothetical protein
VSDQALALLLAGVSATAGFVGWQACRLADSMRATLLEREARRPAVDWTPADDDWLDSWRIRP